jgi:tRNA pseudouridine13 synthase
LTSGLPGLGGAIKILPEDFVVEELPATVPSGEGEHLYLWIEKRGQETPEVAAALARAFSVPPGDVGYAGLKDRQAVTRQWFSVPVSRSSPSPLDVLDLPGARVLETSRHGQKLRSGALRGNRFWIKLRGVQNRAALEPVLQVLRETGVPNWFGPQRFGRRGDNAALGAALIGIGTHPLAARAQRDRFLRKMALSALQSELFNRLLSARVTEGRLAELETGDVVLVPEDRRPVVARDGSLAPRVASFEAKVTGPMFGSKMLAAGGVPGEREARALEQAGLQLDLFARGGGELLGTRRPYRFQLEGVEVREEADGLVLSFDLPAGGYATSVLRELTREPDLPPPPLAGELASPPSRDALELASPPPRDALELASPPPRDAGEGRVGVPPIDLPTPESPDDAPESSDT